MKLFATLLAILAMALPLTAKERLVLYARLTSNVMVDLSDGSKWQMDKGDCFPVIAYKESHTKLILRLASAQFAVPADKAEIVPDKQVADALEKYRANVNTYLNGAADQWRDKAEDKQEKK